MNYNLDLSKIALSVYKELLKSQNLLPGRRILLEEIDERFSSLESHSISTVAELRTALSSAEKVARLSEQCVIPQEYLVILKRESGSLEQKPVLIESFPDIDAAHVASLSAQGIKTSKDYFERTAPSTEELYCLCDLVRINGAGALAAKTFYEAGYQTVHDLAHADAKVMLGRVTEVNNSKQYYKARLGEKDMQFCIDFALLIERYGG